MAEGLSLSLVWLRALGLAVTLSIVCPFASGAETGNTPKSFSPISCELRLEHITEETIPTFSFTELWPASKKLRAFKIMLEGSLKLSRTSDVPGHGRMNAPDAPTPENVKKFADRNFRRAAAFILENYETLEINLSTAIILNKILLEDLYGRRFLGSYKFNKWGFSKELTDTFVNGDVDKFYEWLNSKEAKTLNQNDPVAFAEIIHLNIGALDSFPDGNGRLSRLLSDLVLIKAGLAPAYYTDPEDYFAHGSPQSKAGMKPNYYIDAVDSYMANPYAPYVDRKQKIEYFRKIVSRGQEAMKEGPK